MLTKIVIFIISFLCLFGESTGEEIETRLEAELQMITPKRLCIALILKNVSKEGFFIERAGILYRGSTTARSPFYLKSKTDKRYKYVGPNNTLPSISYNGYTFIPAGRQDVSFFCLSKFYNLDNNLSDIYYRGTKVFYRVNAHGDMEDFGSQQVKSNSLSIKNFPADSVE
jgi:hypothetical protein